MDCRSKGARPVVWKCFWSGFAWPNCASISSGHLFKGLYIHILNFTASSYYYHKILLRSSVFWGSLCSIPLFFVLGEAPTLHHDSILLPYGGYDLVIVAKFRLSHYPKRTCQRSPRQRGKLGPSQLWISPTIRSRCCQLSSLCVQLLRWETHEM